MQAISKNLKSCQNQKVHPEHVEWMQLLRFIHSLSLDLLSTPSKHMVPYAVHPELVEGPGDVPTTYADSSALERDFGFTPKITLREGLRHFAEWYADYYKS